LKEYNSKVNRFEKWDVLKANSRKCQYTNKKMSKIYISLIKSSTTK